MSIILVPIQNLAASNEKKHDHQLINPLYMITLITHFAIKTWDSTLHILTYKQSTYKVTMMEDI